MSSNETRIKNFISTAIRKSFQRLLPFGRFYAKTTTFFRLVPTSSLPTVSIDNANIVINIITLNELPWKLGMRRRVIL